VPGTSSLNFGTTANLDYLSCNAPGECSGVGFYTGANGGESTFVVNETGGTWQPALSLPSTAISANTIEPDALACSSAGNCALGGDYSLSGTQTAAFVANEIGGTWQSAQPLTVSAASAQSSTAMAAVSCAANGQCSATGVVSPATKQAQVFVVTEVNGQWQSGQEIAGLTSLNGGNLAVATTISCVLPGDCTLGGFYTDVSRVSSAFVVDQANGAWGSPLQIPGTSQLNAGANASAISVVCAADDSCSVSGAYTDASNNVQTFVASSAPVFSTPGAPSVVVVAAGSSELLLIVHPPAKSGGLPLLSYEYSVNGGRWIEFTVHDASHLRVGGAVAGKTYQVRVRAANAVGYGVSATSSKVVAR
jgi:hypothetical protein